MTIGRIPSVEGGIQPTIVDAKGDLIAGVAADSVNRLAVGSNDQVLVADSSTSTGLAWKSYGAQVVAGKNAVINGGMDIWQRGTSFTTNYAYTADRWVAGADAGTFTASRSTDVPSTFTYSLSMAGTNTTSAQIYQLIESQNSAHMAGQTVTLSVYAKSTVGSAGLAWLTQIPGATDNWSSASTDQSGTFTASVSGSWTRYSATFTVGANATRGYKIIIYRNVSATSSTTLYTGIQLELGSVATLFSRAGGTIQGELAACQRYYVRLGAKDGGTTSAYDVLAQGSAGSTGAVGAWTRLPVSMRVTPTSIDYANIAAYDNVTVTGTPDSVVIVSAESGRDYAKIAFSKTASFTQYRPYVISNNNNTAGYLGFSAEL